MKISSCLLLLVPLSACGLGEGTGARLVARQRAVDPPYLWLITDLDPQGGVRSATRACADSQMREAFARTSLEFDGCDRLGAVVETPGLVSMRCVADGRVYAFAAAVHGDPARDFQLRVDVRPLDGLSGSASHTRYYHREGPCPASWTVGRLAAATDVSPRPTP